MSSQLAEGRGEQRGKQKATVASGSDPVSYPETRSGPGHGGRRGCGPHRHPGSEGAGPGLNWPRHPCLALTLDTEAASACLRPSPGSPESPGWARAPGGVLCPGRTGATHFLAPQALDGHEALSTVKAGAGEAGPASEGREVRDRTTVRPEKTVAR